MVALLVTSCVTREPAEPPVETIALATTLDGPFAIGGGAVAASAHDGNVPANTVDGSMSTRWSASGDGQWIRYDLGSVSRVAYVKIAFYNGASRIARIDVDTSVDGSTWTTALENVSSTPTNALQTFDFADVGQARFVRIVGHGNSSNAWNSFTEVGVFGGAPSAACSPNGVARCTATGRQMCNFGNWVNMPCPQGTACSGAGTCDYQPCVPGTAICSGSSRMVCWDDGYYRTKGCPVGTTCTGAGQCTGCIENDAYCEGIDRWVCSGGSYEHRNCEFGSVCIGEGDCSECTGIDSKCEGGNRYTCDNGRFVPSACAPGTVCTGEGACTVPTPAQGISSISVNDTSDGNDGIRNDTQWSIEANFGVAAGERAFTDRTFTISALPPGAAHLRGLPWIRTAADSKTYAATPTLATATVTGSFVYLAIDSRHGGGNPAFLTNNGFTLETSYSLTVMENPTTPRTYRVWKKAITAPGTPFALPSIGSATAPCYFVIVQ